MVVILCLLLMASAVILTNVYAEENLYLTDEMRNGRYWNALSNKNKNIFIQGMSEGKWAAIFFLVQSPLFDETEEQYKTKLGTAATVLTPTGATYQEFVGKIDKFYEEEFNRAIPISQVFILMCRKFNSLSTGEEFDIEGYLKDIKEKYIGKTWPTN